MLFSSLLLVFILSAFAAAAPATTKPIYLYEAFTLTGLTYKRESDQSASIVYDFYVTAVLIIVLHTELVQLSGGLWSQATHKR